MQSHDEYIREIKTECKRDIEAEHDRLKAQCIFALVVVGVVIAGAAGLNWVLAWHIEIRILALMAFGWFAISVFEVERRVEKLKFRAQLREDLGWPLEQLREQLQTDLHEMRNDLRDDLKHEIEMHEIRSS